MFLNPWLLGHTVQGYGEYLYSHIPDLQRPTYFKMDCVSTRPLGTEHSVSERPLTSIRGQWFYVYSASIRWPRFIPHIYGEGADRLVSANGTSAPEWHCLLRDTCSPVTWSKWRSWRESFFYMSKWWVCRATAHSDRNPHSSWPAEMACSRKRAPGGGDSWLTATLG